ncbi:peptidase domain-containing ABC transporter [Aquimarina sp. AD10]|uniref:ABC transporter ATP-binding protein n=1 Tax=Aquimarina aggregata TaxID=1642818 RepID=A0A162F9G3_9FLAO|nr:MULTISPECIES: peptidase domain-containing ABC transporter [Aquimarina]AXT62153.1 peptidase domain-containing ABC transporter [Aquimarina sp. AD10]KZS39846.1 ABC transporter ATP-binding protein [Aquimarina aggregata]RKM90652.1 peptidase domain-containing ABC transporter [Aquimarina sp. AD10]
MKTFPFYKQPGAKDCGPTCLRIISKHHGKVIPLETIRNLSQTTRTGSSFLGLAEASENMGFKSIGIKTDYETFKEDVPLPCIVHWKKYHFVVVYKIKNDRVYISDPSYGLIDYSKKEFVEAWIGNNANEKTQEGLILSLDTTPKFYDTNWDKVNNGKSGFSFLFRYLFKYKSLMMQLLVGLLAGSLLQLIFPFLTQSIVDIGIQNQDINFIHLILGAQIMLFIGQISIDAIRGWILLHLSTRINISLVSDFFIKLMNLPISYFDTRMTGDLMQRINDHQRIEKLLTNSSLNTLFSFFNIVVFSAVLAYYNLKIFGIFAIGSTLLVIWILFFLKKRKELDYKRFKQMSDEQSKTIELIEGMQEIKLHNAEKQKRWGWEFIQIRLFKVATQGLTLEQTQTIGSTSINQFKNILITFTSASLVLSGQISLGMMLSIQYIIGQLNNPISQLLQFIQETQDAKISLERLKEVHDQDNEENIEDAKVYEIPTEGDIKIENLTFRYIGAEEPIIKDMNLVIPRNKKTAIVGASGSGKTTLMKALMRFYKPNKGLIKIGDQNFENISQKTWRGHCGVVMQDGYIFNDTIANNIALGEDYIDKDKLLHAVKVANIKDFIERLPLSYNTEIGNEGVGISGGEKQRLLIARAVYKNPDFIFFDEATSALDANNEKTIMENLNTFFKGRTAVVIAHRLSTVKNADQILVMDNGKIVEKGTHKELLDYKGAYYELVKNQLELEKLNGKKPLPAEFLNGNSVATIIS